MFRASALAHCASLLAIACTSPLSPDDHLATRRRPIAEVDAGSERDAGDATDEVAADRKDAGSLASAQPSCGDGRVADGERCDTAIAEGKGACPVNCSPPGDPCKRSALVGSGCDAHCEETIISESVAGDRCCPSGSRNEDDADCEAVCGNGHIEKGETCERDAEPGCPMSCDDGNVCTEDARSGSEDHCDVICSHAPRVAGAADGCCPAGASSSSDPDCTIHCGNGMREGSEACDDGNQTPGDGCDAMCSIEAPREPEKPQETCDNLGAGDLCSLCACAQCGARGGGCTGLFPSSRVQSCLAVSSCIGSAGCDLVECYCGSDLAGCAQGKPSGPCQAEIVKAVGSSEVAVVLAQLRDERAPLARALRQTQCEARQCGAVCGNR